MRLWSIHPKYLDRMGLLALWREGLLAQKVLAGKTKGYKHHPQLLRFKNTKDPLLYIGRYLDKVCDEAEARKYCFDRNKILKTSKEDLPRSPITRGQIKFEFQHLKNKLEMRDPEKARSLNRIRRVQPHPLFKGVPGDVAAWEVREEK